MLRESSEFLKNMERMLQVFGFTVKHYLMVPSGKPIKNPIPYLGGRFRVY